MKLLLVLAVLVIAWIVYHFTSKIYFDKGKEYVYKHTTNQIDTLQKNIKYLESLIGNKNKEIDKANEVLKTAQDSLQKAENSLETTKHVVNDYNKLIEKLSANDELHNRYIALLWILFVNKVSPFRKNISYRKEYYEDVCKLIVKLDIDEIAIPITEDTYNKLKCPYSSANHGKFTKPMDVVNMISRLI